MSSPTSTSYKEILLINWHIVILLVCLLAGCTAVSKKDTVEAQQRKEFPALWAEIDRDTAFRASQKKEVSSGSMTCIEHGVTVNRFYVEDVAHGQTSFDERGGSFSCGGQVSNGYPVPKKWVPGLTVRVRWATFDRGTYYWHEKYTTIAPYTDDGDVWVHFFPNDEVRVVVSLVGASGTAHPIKRDAKVPPPEDPSHVDVPIAGVNVDCVSHGGFSVAIGTDITIDNPNFSNPAGDLATRNHRDLRVVHKFDALHRDYVEGCRNPTGLQVDRRWQPNKKVAVVWRRSPTAEEVAKQLRKEHIRVTRMVSVPRYDHPMPAWLHLFPNDQVRLVFSDEPPDSPKHPIARDAVVPPPEGE